MPNGSSQTVYARLADTAIANQGTANNAPVTARALAWILAGHAQHHLDVLRERYQLEI